MWKRTVQDGLLTVKQKTELATENKRQKRLQGGTEEIVMRRMYTCDECAEDGLQPGSIVVIG